MTIKDLKHPGLFAAGVLFGTAGIKALSSKDAKKLYTNCTAAVLRAKKVVMDTVTTIQENAEDIYADAKQINEEREAAEEAVEDVLKRQQRKLLKQKQRIRLRHKLYTATSDLRRIHTEKTKRLQNSLQVFF